MFAIAFCLGMLWGCFGLATFLVIIDKRDSRPLRDRTAQRGRLRLAGGTNR